MAKSFSGWVVVVDLLDYHFSPLFGVSQAPLPVFALPHFQQVDCFPRARAVAAVSGMRTYP